MIQKTIYVTQDGTEFDDEAAAKSHESLLEKMGDIEAFVATLHTGKQARTISLNAIKGWLKREAQ